MKTKQIASALGIVIGVLLLIFATPSEASDKISCDILTIEASTSNQGIDPTLNAYASIFRKKPFDNYNTFKLVKIQSYQLSLSSMVNLAMPQPLGGTLLFSGENNGKLNLTLTIRRPVGEPAVIKGIATSGTPFFAAGLRGPNGNRWIFGVICKKEQETVHY